MSLWLCLRFEQLPLECLQHDPHQAVAVLAQQRVLRASDSALQAGIQPGMGTATCRALAPELRLLERDPAAEQRTLQQLCCWAYGISPTLHSFREDCLLLEVGSCLSLHQGLTALLDNVRRGLSSRGYTACQGLAPTPRAAWLLSFSDEDCSPASDRAALQRQLAPLPLDLLDDFPRQVNALRRAGLHHLGDLLNLPPAALARRCGKEFSHFLAQVLGDADDRQADFQPPATFSDQYWFGYEVRANSELVPAIQLLLKTLCRFLRNTQLQTGEIRWQLIGIDSKVRDLLVRSTHSHSDWQDWYRLTAIRLEQLQMETPVEGLGLHCDQLRSGELPSLDLFSPGNQREPMGSLLDRLRNRLGLQAIHRVGCRDEHVPEDALWRGCDEPPVWDPGPLGHCAQRPFWLMDQPKPLRQNGARLFWQGRLELRYGPERIEDNWWHQPVSRDYYIAEGRSGEFYWIFRDRRARSWFIHGVFA